MRLSIFVLGLLLALPGCVGTPQPNPPSLDGARLAAGGQRGSMINVLGAPGAVQPAGSRVWVTPLDTVADPVEVVSGEDGSFEVNVAQGVHRLEPRLDAEEGGVRGAVVDVEVDLGLAILRSASPCLEIPLVREAPASRVGASVELEVAIVNRCASAVEVTRAAMRRPSDFEVLDAPATVAAGSSASVRARFAPTGEGPREEIVLLEVSGPANERRAVTLFGLGTP